MNDQIVFDSMELGLFEARCQGLLCCGVDEVPWMGRIPLDLYFDGFSLYLNW